MLVSPRAKIGKPADLATALAGRRSHSIFAPTMSLRLVAFLSLLLTACQVSSPVGTYRSRRPGNGSLVLDSAHKFYLNYTPAYQGLIFNHDTLRRVFATSGTWTAKGRDILLQSEPVAPLPRFEDSLGMFTNISSFTFVDPAGEPVPVRHIVFYPDKLKPHYGNSLFFFAQDFAATDTLTFFFNGYPPFRYPGDVRYIRADNMHKITLYPEQRTDLFQQHRVKLRGKKLKLGKGWKLIRQFEDLKIR